MSTVKVSMGCIALPRCISIESRHPVPSRCCNTSASCDSPSPTHSYLPQAQLNQYIISPSLHSSPSLHLEKHRPPSFPPSHSTLASASPHVSHYFMLFFSLYLASHLHPFGLHPPNPVAALPLSFVFSLWTCCWCVKKRGKIKVGCVCVCVVGGWGWKGRILIISGKDGDEDEGESCRNMKWGEGRAEQGRGGDGGEGGGEAAWAKWMCNCIVVAQTFYQTTEWQPQPSLVKVAESSLAAVLPCKQMREPEPTPLGSNVPISYCMVSNVEARLKLFPLNYCRFCINDPLVGKNSKELVYCAPSTAPVPKECQPFSHCPPRT